MPNGKHGGLNFFYEQLDLTIGTIKRDISTLQDRTNTLEVAVAKHDVKLNALLAGVGFCITLLIGIALKLLS